MAKLNIPKVKKAIESSYGVLITIANACGVSRIALYHFLNKHPKLRDLIESEKERILDVAEKQLFVNVAKGDQKAIKFFLSTKGKKRDYVTKQLIESDNRTTLTHEDFAEAYELSKKKKAEEQKINSDKIEEKKIESEGEKKDEI